MSQKQAKKIRKLYRKVLRQKLNQQAAGSLLETDSEVDAVVRIGKFAEDLFEYLK